TSWTIDLTPPDTALATVPNDPMPSTSAEVGFTGDEPASFECQLDGEAFAPCVTPIALYGLAEGAHDFAVRAVDLAGNLDPTPARVHFVVDVTSPETSLA